jgi:molybdate transport system substrate-binding protein
VRALVSGFVCVVLATNLSSCGETPPRASHSATQGHSAAQSIKVFAAASLKPTFTLLAGKFQTDNPGVTVHFDFAVSSELATQLTSGARADIFASSDTAQMDTVAKAALTETEPVNFASNTLVIVAAPGNPKRIRSFADLAKPGLKVVICREPVPCAALTQRIEDKTDVHFNPVSEEPTASDVLAKVVSGSADAGLVYVTEARTAGAKVSTVDFAEAADATNVYPIAVLKHASEPALAQRFINLVTGPLGQQVLNQAGFTGP